MAVKASAKALKKALDMSKAARMKRAREMGFDVDNTAYRGLGRAYDPNKQGYYQMFTSSPQDAREYASSDGNVVAAYLKRGRAFDVDAGGANFSRVPIKSLPNDVIENLHPYAKEVGVATTDEIAHAAKAAGYDSASIKNVFDQAYGEVPLKPATSQADSALLNDLFADMDRAGFSVDDGEALPIESVWGKNYDPVTVDVVFNPSNIRSVNAAFDPAKADSPNLLASAAPLAVGAGLLGQSGESEAGVASTLARLGYYASNAADGTLSLYKKSGEKVGSFESTDDAIKKAMEDSGKALPSGSVVDAPMVRKEDAEGFDASYRGGHTAPVDPEYTAPLSDLTGIYPEDIYSAQGPRYYGHAQPDMDQEAFSVLNAVRGQPESMVDAYRAVPMSAPDQIMPGDWVTTSPIYARQHGEGLGDYKILKGQTEAKRLRTDGNSPHEYGYTGSANPYYLAALGAGSAMLPTLNKYAGQALEAIDKPLSGLLGLSRIPAGLLAGESFDEAMNAAANQVRQGSDRTLYDIGGVVTDRTGNPYLGTAAYAIPSMLSPF